MRQATGWTIGVVVLGITTAALLWTFLRQGNVATAPPAEFPAPAPQSSPTAPLIHYPLASAPAPGEHAEPLPPLEQSDAAMQEAAARLIGRNAWTSYFYPDLVIRRIVATVDNLPRSQVAARMMPVKPAGDAFRSVKVDDGFVIDAANASRYARHVALVREVSVPALVDAYVRFYPLFQRAYEDLGYPNGYFNDRLIVAIDDLLAAPTPEAPVLLTQPRVLYEYADADLEARSAGQKIMLRIGRDNETQVKAKLRELRQELLRRTAETAGAAKDAR